MQDKSVIIVGAGIAGLVAARELAGHFHVTILEADMRIGGRIRSLQPAGFNKVVEAGPEFVHGHLPQTIALLKEAGIGYEPLNGKFLRKEKGEWKQREEMLDGWDELLDRMGSIGADMTMESFLEKYYSADSQAGFRQQVIGYTEGFDIADTRRVSVRSLYQEWQHEDPTNFRLLKGYGELTDFLGQQLESKGVSIATGHAVKHINWRSQFLKITTSDGKLYECDKAIVAVPLPVLQDTTHGAAIDFIPAIGDYISAANQIGMGDVIKVVIQFKESLWPTDMGFILSDETFPTWWTQLPDTNPLLTGWLGGTRATRLAGETDESLLDKAIISLANIFEISPDQLRAEIKASVVFNWKKMKWVTGAYSYATPESIIARKLLNTPLSGKIFFSGEALYEGTSPGTVEAAIVQGKQTAARLIEITKDR